MNELSHIIPFLPEALLALGTIALLMIGAFTTPRATLAIAMIGALLLAVVLVLVSRQPTDTVVVFNHLLTSSAFTIFAKVLIVLGALLPLLLSVEWLKKPENQRFEYVVLLLIATLGLMLLVSVNDLLSVYMALELSSLSLYVMAAFARDDAKSSEAGLKYFVLGALASGMMLFGASLVYGFTGTTNFTTLAKLLSVDVDAELSIGAVVGLVFVLVGFCFKISAAPFHMWAPDVYEGAPTPVVTFFAGAPKMAAMLLLVRVLMEPFAVMIDEWQQIIMVVAILSMVMGAFGALRQTNLKRLLAYSSIGHVGYALVGLASGSAQGAQAMLVYLSIYLFMSVAAFGFLMALRRGEKELETIADLSGLSKTCPKSALFMAIVMFSMAGIPPLAGFFAKFEVFLSAVQHGLYPLVVIGLLSSVVAAYYYIRIVKVMYFDEAAEPFERDVSLLSRAVLGLCALVIMGYFLVPSAIAPITELAAAALAL